MHCLQGRRLSAVLAVALLCGVGSGAEAATTFERVADTSTTVPGSAAPFASFGRPSLSAGNVAFRGSRSGGPLGVYAERGAGLERIVEEGDAVPGGGTFGPFFSSVVIDGADVGFETSVTGDPFTGSNFVYRESGGVVSQFADGSVTVPGLGPVRVAFTRSARDGVLGIAGSAGPATPVVYTSDGVGITTLATGGDGVPGTGGTQTFGSFGTPFVDDSGVVFRANSDGSLGAGLTGLYADTGSGLREIANTLTAIPGGSQGAFSTLTDSVLDDGRVVFRGGNGAGYAGLFEDDAGALSILLDSDTLIPGEVATFAAFEAPAIEGGSVAFVGEDATSTAGGLYVLDEAGMIEEIVGLGDVLDGRTVAGLGIGENGFEANEDLGDGLLVVALERADAAGPISFDRNAQIQARQDPQSGEVEEQPQGIDHEGLIGEDHLDQRVLGGAVAITVAHVIGADQDVVSGPPFEEEIRLRQLLDEDRILVLQPIALVAGIIDPGDEAPEQVRVPC